MLALDVNSFYGTGRNETNHTNLIKSLNTDIIYVLPIPISAYMI